MVEAMVADTSRHLASIQSKRDTLEGALAEGKDDDAISIQTQSLSKGIKDYKESAKHVKKHCAKPKKAKELAPSGADENSANGA